MNGESYNPIKWIWENVDHPMIISNVFFPEDEKCYNRFVKRTIRKIKMLNRIRKRCLNKRKDV